MMTPRSIVRGDLDLYSKSLKILDSRQIVGRPSAIAESDAASFGNNSRRAAEPAQAEIFLSQGEKRRLADPARDHHQVIRLLRTKTIPQRAPNLQPLSCVTMLQPAGELSLHEINHV